MWFNFGQQLRISGGLVLYLGLGLVTIHAEVLQHVTVSTKYGEVTGKRTQEDYDVGIGAMTDTVDVFLGVPYAAPPVGDLRFKPPEPPEKWTEARDATKPGPVCPQIVYYSQTAEEYQSEDCLYLNIYSPVPKNKNSTTSFPVMVFIHGGSYEEGAGSRYNGFVLAQHGVVVVTINYRLGVLGYLTTGGSDLQGNYGFLDQIEVLRWVADNIKRFRGEWCNVTLFGNSAGSSSVGLLMLADKARSLFNRAILQSGSPMAFWATYNQTANYEQFFESVANTVGCKQENNEERIHCLMDVHYSNFTYHHWNFSRIVPSNLNFKPRVDGEILKDQARELFTSGRYHNMSVMIGTVQDEWARSMGWFFNDIEGYEESDFKDGFNRESFEKSVDHVITQRFWWSKQAAKAVTYAYTDWTDISDPFMNREAYKEMTSDLIMVAPSVELAEILSRHGTSVYYYNFNHTSEFTDPPWWKCYHSLELDSVFGSPFTGYNIAVDEERNHTETDKEISRITMLLWSNFAKNGNPTPHPVQDTTWTPLDTSLDNYLHISTPQVEMQTHLRADKMAFWNMLIPVLNAQEEEDVSLARPTNMNLTLMWFFGILAVISFLLSLALIVRNNKIRKKLEKVIALNSQPV